MLKYILFTTVIIFQSFESNAQSDTIFTNNEKIPCVVKKVTQDAIEYTFPNEEVITTVYKNVVQKIIFKSGRKQFFSEATSFKSVRGADDFGNVTFASVQSEVNGLFKLGDVSSAAEGATVFSNMEKVKEKAYKKMKIVASMMGANVIYLTSNSTIGNQMGSAFQAAHSTATNISGIAYSNKIPDFEEFQKIIGSKTLFQSLVSYKMSQGNSDFVESRFTHDVKLSNTKNESGLIMVNVKIRGVYNDIFRVISFNNKEFTLSYKDGQKIYNYKIQL